MKSLESDSIDDPYIILVLTRRSRTTQGGVRKALIASIKLEDIHTKLQLRKVESHTHKIV